MRPLKQGHRVNLKYAFWNNKGGTGKTSLAFQAIARYAEGGLRDAESALDQAISFYGDRVSEADVLSLFGLTGFAPVAALGRALERHFSALRVLGVEKKMLNGAKRYRLCPNEQQMKDCAAAWEDARCPSYFGPNSDRHGLLLGADPEAVI